MGIFNNKSSKKAAAATATAAEAAAEVEVEAEVEAAATASTANRKNNFCVKNILNGSYACGNLLIASGETKAVKPNAVIRRAIELSMLEKVKCP